MTPGLYLDTARLGQMCPTAQRAQRDFAGLAGDVAGAIRFERFLRHGFNALPIALQTRYAGLAEWKGIKSLKNSICRLAKLEAGLPVLLASRSAQLMKLAAILLCRPCENILVTDLGWPGYQRILDTECHRAGRLMTTVPLRDALLSGQVDENEVVARVREEYIKHHCDGLFLPAVSNTGLRLPVQRISRTLERECDVRCVVVDGAQDFCHVESDLRDDCCDLYLAGCHKWLGAYHPLGLAFYGRCRSQGVIETVLADALAARDLDDPLLRFVEHLCRDGATPDDDETVNLSALFSCQGAVSEAIAMQSRGADDSDLSTRKSMAQRVAEMAADAHWLPRMPHSDLQTGILLLQSDRQGIRGQSPEYLRTMFYDNGVALTAYEAGMIRLSMPAWKLEHHELRLLETALRSIA